MNMYSTRSNEILLSLPPCNFLSSFIVESMRDSNERNHKRQIERATKNKKKRMFLLQDDIIFKIKQWRSF